MGNLLIDRTSMEPHFPEVLARFEVNTSFCLHAGSLGYLVRTKGKGVYCVLCIYVSSWPNGSLYTCLRGPSDYEINYSSVWITLDAVLGVWLVACE